VPVEIQFPRLPSGEIHFALLTQPLPLSPVVRNKFRPTVEINPLDYRWRNSFHPFDTAPLQILGFLWYNLIGNPISLIYLEKGRNTEDADQE